ncbi:MAG: type IX secretion system sortase PorU, partial [Bacteroidales bacterium]|nr:type IX secretion system sortase PorU [Bacteroidales bacterium]
VLEIQDIGTWKNKYNMPVFVTATCEFSRFDDPERVSAGELTFLSTQGGAIALFTTTRLSFSSSNFALNLNFYDKVFKKINGKFPKMGDVIRLSKTPSNPNIRNFILLGDPALRLAYPEHRVFTSSINGRVIDGKTDTLRALSKVTITGRIGNESGQTLTSFNGIIYPTIYDKPAEVITKGNDVDSSPRKFMLQKNILYKGKASVVDGEYSFTFVVPKDIAYRMDYGRISYYATDGETDAAGFYENIMIGGSAPDSPIDDNGPEISLYMNDTNFVMQGITDENPVMLAYVRDSSGVNTVGNGIGHDIIAILDGNTEQSIVLNDYYEADLDSYRSGVIRYPFFGLAEGKHTLQLKVWDVYNNSSTAYIEFEVADSDNLTLNHLYSYPNPMQDHTWFVFEHNQPGMELDIDLRIYALDGRMVHAIRQRSYTVGYRTEPMLWDGRMDNGMPVPGGFYVYRVRVDGGNGYSNEMSGKMIIAR